MRKTLKKLLLGGEHKTKHDPSGSLHNRIQNIRMIWNNEHHDDVGIEKLFRLFLAMSQFLFPGIYIKHIFGKKGIAMQDVAMDVYILLKVFLPLILLYNNIHHSFFLALVTWFMIETLLYVPTLIFASDFLSRPTSYHRSMLMLFLNYMEITFAFAMLYASGDYLNQPFIHWYDPIYVSFTSLGTVGFGDFFPVTGFGKFLVCMQSVIFLSFVVLFINFFSNKVESRGYFDHTSNDSKSKE